MERRSIVALCLASTGCTALLGDFTRGDVGDAGAVDLGADGAAGEAGSARDAASAADGSGGGAADAAAPLACTTWRYASPVIVETLSAGDRRVSGAVSVVSGPGSVARVIAGKASAGVAFSVYTIDKSQAAPQVTRVDAPAAPGAAFAAAARGQGGTTVIAYATGPQEGGALGAFSAYPVPDTMPGTGPLPSPFVVYQETPLVPAVDAIRVLPLGGYDGDAGAGPHVLAAVTYPAQAPATGEVLAVGLASAGAPATLSAAATSANAAGLDAPYLFHDTSDGQVYVFDADDPSSPGLSEWAVPDTGVVAAPVQARAVVAGAPARIDAIGTSAAGGGAADVAFEQETTSGAYVTSITYRAGTVPGGTLGAWTPADLPVVETSADVFTAPAGIPCGSVWAGDNLMLLGPGLRAAGADAGVAPGLNLLWLDATGALRSSGPGPVLADRDDFSSAAASPIEIAAGHARWDVVWVETRSDDAGAYDAILYDELDCQ